MESLPLVAVPWVGTDIALQSFFVAGGVLDVRKWVVRGRGALVGAVGG